MGRDTCVDYGLLWGLVGAEGLRSGEGVEIIVSMGGSEALCISSVLFMCNFISSIFYYLQLKEV